MENCCRICLTDDEEENLIAPCYCKGTSRFVHRDCLDKWRCQHERSFYTCTECTTPFVMDIKDGGVNSETKLKLFLAFDLGIFIGLFLLLSFAMGYVWCAEIGGTCQHYEPLFLFYGIVTFLALIGMIATILADTRNSTYFDGEFGIITMILFAIIGAVVVVILTHKYIIWGFEHRIGFRRRCVSVKTHIVRDLNQIA